MGDKPTVMLAGGGTGGHVYPGIALARELERQGELHIRWVGTEGRVESWAVPHAGYPIDYLDVQFLKGRTGRDRLSALLRLPKALWDAFRLLRRHKPAAVVGLGGFVSGPICLVAGLMFKKVYLLEQNAHAGWTNRINGLVATKIFATFDASKKWFPEEKVEVLGNPIRRELLEEATRAEQAREPLPIPHEELHVLVVGGSQGSLTLNGKLPPIFATLHQEGIGFCVKHASGKGRQDEVKPGYRDAGFDVEIVEYIDDMASAYAWADLLICRAGATTISEVTALGLPAVYVPFPFAADDHQTENARAVVAAEAGWMVTDDELDESKGLMVLRDAMTTMRDLETRTRIIGNVRALARPLAGAQIAEKIWSDIR